ncbi:ribosomal-processing cysteine protease Prp [bacterium]|nr:MAG: ribosomal-processing cysteine protease Prp [bacterium]
MLKVRFREDGRGRLSSFSAEGHVEYAVETDDVVCAAASAILQAAWLGLQEHLQIAVEAERSPGTLRLRWGEDGRASREAQAVLGTARLAIETLARQYPQNIAVSTARD